MCGIAGAVGPRADRAPLVEAMTARMIHRGPDATGHWHGPTCSLAMRRLSIIDLAGGSQPLYNESGDVAVICNGEIYNFQTLRQELAAAGHVFRTGSDVEVVVHGYEAWGEAVLSRLNGMFALAIWDGRAARLLLARDRVGKKPLYYAQMGDSLAFASELRALLTWPQTWTVAPDACRAFVARGYFPGASTPFAEIRRLLPAELAIWDGKALQRRRYWSPVIQPFRGDRNSAVADLHTLLRESVQLRLISDVPVGAFLSGGLDSSVVVALAAGELGARIPTFSVSFPGYDDFDEGPFARRVAEHFGCEHTEIAVDARHFDDIADVVWALDEPLADPAALPTLLLSRSARTKVTVVLTGEGADEVFGGYERYELSLRGAAIARRVPLVASVARGVLGWRGARRTDDSRWSRVLRACAEGSADPVAWSRALARVAAFGRPAPDPSLGDGTAAAAAAAGRLAAVQLDDLFSLLPDSLLTKVDRMTMAASLEARCPYLDYRVVEFGLSLPDRWKIGRRSKVLLRAMAERLLPDSIRRRPKHTFRVPIGAWLRGPLRRHLDALAASDRLAALGIVPQATVRALVDAHTARRAEFGRALWSLVTLDLWLARAEATAALRRDAA